MWYFIFRPIRSHTDHKLTASVALGFSRFLCCLGRFFVCLLCTRQLGLAIFDSIGTDSQKARIVTIQRKLNHKLIYLYTAVVYIAFHLCSLSILFSLILRYSFHILDVHSIFFLSLAGCSQNAPNNTIFYRFQWKKKRCMSAACGTLTNNNIFFFERLFHFVRFCFVCLDEEDKKI